MNMTKVNIDKRVDKAVALFKEGYNCSQSVFIAYCDLYGVAPEFAARMSGSFGGGLGRQREVCGAVSGAAMVLGFKYPFIDPSDLESKRINYKAVQKFCAEFKVQCGSIVCRELLGAKSEPITHVAEERTQEYYKKRPCAELVAIAARIVGEQITAEEDL